MSQQIVCDGCGEPIDPTISYYTGSFSVVQEIDGVLTSGGSAVQLDYHTEHVPQGIRQDPEPD